MSCVTQEITYYKLSHLAENLTQVLSSEEDSLAERAGVVMPSNQEILQTLQPINNGDVNPLLPAKQFPDEDPHPFELFSNCIVAVIWIDTRDRKHLFLSCVVEHDKEDPDVAKVSYLV